MIKDPKQIVTPYAFSVHKSLLGLPLATPKRRLAALLIDLLLAAILATFGPYLMATIISVLFFWIAVRTKSETFWKNALRYPTAALFTILIFFIAYSYASVNDKGIQVKLNDSGVITSENSGLNFGDIASKAMAIDYSDSANAEEAIEQLAREIEASFTENTSNSENRDNMALFSEDNVLSQLESFSISIQQKDTLAADSLREILAPVIASIELEQQSERIRTLKARNKKLKDENEVLEEKVEHPGFITTLKGAAEDFGLGFGWVGIYFIVSLAYFKGQTPGKKLLSIKVVRLNNKDISFWYSFERFGGYAAGVATGLLGFFQVYWDPNRQAIHDKIAGTVVIDKREKRIKKFAYLRNELIDGQE